MRVDVTGERFGRLVAISHRIVVSENGRSSTRWTCRCDCGNQTEVLLTNLKNGNCTSCGCWRKERASNLNASHGMSNSREYAAWGAMISRCHNPNAQAAQNYGQRGIVVCDRWRSSFETFYADMGPRPSDQHSIERRDVNGNYEPGNCYWATTADQAMNRRNTLYVEYQGRTITLKDLATLVDIPYAKLYERIYRLGQSVEKATSLR